jgi:hypothetical protein
LVAFFGFLTLYGAASVASYASIIGGGSLVTYRADYAYDIRLAVLFSASFIVLSGYVVTASVEYVLDGRSRTWKGRALINSCLVVMHLFVFALFIASSLSVRDMLLAVFGIVSVVLSEFSVHLMETRLLKSVS